MNMHFLDKFVHLGHSLRYARDRYFDNENQAFSITDATRAHVREALDAALEVSRELDLRALEAFIQETIEDMPETYDAFDVVIRTIFTSLGNEVAFVVPATRRKFFDTDMQFEAEIESKFPMFASEMVSAARSIGFGLPAGAVFYLMRVMEASVAVLATKLGIQNVDKEWGKILSDIDAKIELMPKSDERKRWSELRSNLWHVKECWRNETMHPRRSYTQEQGEDIYKAVRAFLIQMASFVS